VSKKGWSGIRICTLGHSTRTLDELLALLASFEIRVLADVRTLPRSRRHPHFDGGALAEALAARGLRYVHLARLGGLRRPRPDSPNTGWRHPGFRGFADYMGTDEFEGGLEELRALPDEGLVALLCAEAVPWRCHRSLVADALTARGAEVEHIVGPARSTRHELTSFARVEAGRVRYPGLV
jgi:uncharacterized protein (DUF488 family)